MNESFAGMALGLCVVGLVAAAISGSFLPILVVGLVVLAAGGFTGGMRRGRR
jgi:hypothetical protein